MADDAHRAIRQLHPQGILQQRVLEEPADAGREVARVVVRLEADHVGAEQPRQQLLPPLADAEYLGGRERDVPEQPGPHGGAGDAQVAGDEAEMEIVHPDGVARLRELAHRLGEALVDALVRAPEGGVELAPVGKDVAQRPQYLVGEPSIVIFDLAVAQVHGVDGVGQPGLGGQHDLVDRGPCPRHPDPGALAERHVERRGEAADCAAEAPFSGRRRHLHRRAIRNHHESGLPRGHRRDVAGAGSGRQYDS